jgi:hypothetical protein
MALRAITVDLDVVAHASSTRIAPSDIRVDLTRPRRRGARGVVLAAWCSRRGARSGVVPAHLFVRACAREDTSLRGR